MTDRVAQLANPPKNIKMRSSYRDSMYHVLRDKDQSGLFGQPGEIFPIAFAIGYHFGEKRKPGKDAINHVNLVSLSLEFKELAARLIIARNPEIEDPSELWREVEQYAEYGIQVLFNAWKRNDGSLEIDRILESPEAQ